METEEPAEDFSPTQRSPYIITPNPDTTKHLENASNRPEKRLERTFTFGMKVSEENMNQIYQEEIISQDETPKIRNESTPTSKNSSSSKKNEEPKKPAKNSTNNISNILKGIGRLEAQGKSLKHHLALKKFDEQSLNKSSDSINSLGDLVPQKLNKKSLFKLQVLQNQESDLGSSVELKPSPVRKDSIENPWAPKIKKKVSFDDLPERTSTSSNPSKFKSNQVRNS